MASETDLESGPAKFLVTNIQRYSINDGPGIRTTVFLKGCPLNCAWCHNPEAINPHQEFFFNEDKCQRCGQCAKVCPRNAIRPPVKRRIVKDPEVRPIISSSGSILDKIKDGTFGSEELYDNVRYIADRTVMAQQTPLSEIAPPDINREKCNYCMKCVAVCAYEALTPVSQQRTLDEIYCEVLADREFYETSGGGMTLSGGEPLLQPEVTLSLLKRARADGIHTALDTTGLCKWETIDRVLPYVDLVLFDVKVLDDVKHQKWTDVSNKLILENLMKIAETDVPIRIRCVVVHNVNYWEPDHPKSVVEFAKRLGSSISGIDIIPYHNFAEKKYEQLGRNYIFKGFPNLFNEDVESYVRIMAQYGPWKPTIGGIG